jgi:hypothetical protein
MAAALAKGTPKFSTAFFTMFPLKLINIASK